MDIYATAALSFDSEHSVGIATAAPSIANRWTDLFHGYTRKLVFLLASLGNPTDPITILRGISLVGESVGVFATGFGLDLVVAPLVTGRAAIGTDLLSRFAAFVDQLATLFRSPLCDPFAREIL